NAIGDRVKAGDVLVRIAVPDLEQDVLQKEAVLAQRQSELGLATANVKTAAKAEQAAAAMVKVKESEGGGGGGRRQFRQAPVAAFHRPGGRPEPGRDQGRRRRADRGLRGGGGRRRNRAGGRKGGRSGTGESQGKVGSGGSRCKGSRIARRRGPQRPGQGAKLAGLCDLAGPLRRRHHPPQRGPRDLSP